MAMDIILRGGVSGTGADVLSGNQLLVTPERDSLSNPNNVGDTNFFSEVDHGYTTGNALLRSPEADGDFRLRVAPDLLLEEENFNYTAQSTGKYLASATTLTAAYAAGTATLNSSGVTTTATGIHLASYAFFPMDGATTLSGEFILGWDAPPNANSFCEFGIGIVGTTIAAPTDGVFFRLSSAGLQGVASNNGTETVTSIFTGPNGAGTWAYTNNTRYQFVCYQNATEALFWVNDGIRWHLLGSIPKPVGQQRMCMASSGQWFVKHRITGGAAGAVMRTLIGAVSIRMGGQNNISTVTVSGNRKYGSYQGLSGGTMGSLATYANSANPVAAVPTNTTAALGTGLGGQFWETDTLAVTTDGIIDSYQVPAGTVNIPGRRLVLRGVKIDSFVQTALTGGGYNAQWSLAFGHTAVSLTTAEGAATKAPRRIPLGSQTVAAAAAALTQLSTVAVDFGDAPVFVNPGEFIAVVKKKVGTAPSAGVIAHLVTMIYGWE